MSSSKRAKVERVGFAKILANPAAIRTIFEFAGTQSNDLKKFLWIARGDRSLQAKHFKIPEIKERLMKTTSDGRKMPSKKRPSAYTMWKRTSFGKNNPSWWGQNVKQSKDAATGKKLKSPIIHNRRLLNKYEQEAHIESIFLSEETESETNARRRRSILLKKAEEKQRRSEEKASLDKLKASHSLYWGNKDVIGKVAVPFHDGDETLLLTPVERVLYITWKETELLLADSQKAAASFRGKAYAAIKCLDDAGVGF